MLNALFSHDAAHMINKNIDNAKSSRFTDATVKFLIPDSGPGFSQLVLANTKKLQTKCLFLVWFDRIQTIIEKRIHDISSLVSEFKEFFSFFLRSR